MATEPAGHNSTAPLAPTSYKEGHLHESSTGAPSLNYRSQLGGSDKNRISNSLEEPSQPLGQNDRCLGGEAEGGRPEGADLASVSS